MDIIYSIYTSKGDLIMSTRDFDLALYLYATADKKDGWPRFSWQASSESRQAPAISGYPDAFLPR